ncbi:hypothetical protein [Pelosinus sp. sgz500959]|uniref:hypothetical protein n=1 Tax=Pelosinus sp. sgz500959 TaxID=3242472 RepID=UPI00366AB1EA
MERETATYAITLTLYEKYHKGNREEMSAEQLTKHTKAMLESIRRKAKLRQWKYQVITVISDTHLSKGGIKGGLHVHMALYGNPCFTIVSEIKKYWIKKKLANVIIFKKWYSMNWLDYCNGQILRKFYQSEGIEKMTEKQLMEHLSSTVFKEGVTG